MIKIIKCDNGAFLEHEYQDCYTNEVKIQRLAFTFEQNNVTGLADLLYEIKNLVADQDSGYDKEKVFIVLGKDADKKCPFCLRDYQEIKQEFDPNDIPF